MDVNKSSTLKKRIIIGVILGAVILVFILAVVFVMMKLQQRAMEKIVQDFSSEDIDGLIEKARTTSKDRACEGIREEIGIVKDCSKFRKTEDQDICYYCFAIDNLDNSLCQKIADSTWQELCQKDTLIEKLENEIPKADDNGNLETEAKNSRIISAMSQIRIEAVMIYTMNGNYQTLNCEHISINPLCVEIKNQSGQFPVIKSKSEEYCAYAQLLNGDYYFIDSEGFAEQINDLSEISGLCSD